MIPSPNVTRIPGNILPVAVSDNRIKDFTKLSKLELLDLKHREEQLLGNKRQINKLPDKGARIKALYEKIVAEVERRDALEAATKLFSNLNIAETGAVDLTEMEWKNGNVQIETATKSASEKDSDDEEEVKLLEILENPTKNVKDVKVLKILARRTKNENEVKTEMSAREAELVEIDLAKSFNRLKPKLEKVLLKANQQDKVDIDPHSSHLIEKSEVLAKPQREKFKPYKTTINNTHDPVKEISRKQGQHWENTAATPPPLQHTGTQMVSLLDSVQIQNDYMHRLKAIHTEQACERLQLKNTRLLERGLLNPATIEHLKTSSLFTKYRDIEGNLHAEEKDNDDDLAEEEKSSIVKYTYSE